MQRLPYLQRVIPTRSFVGLSTRLNAQVGVARRFSSLDIESELARLQKTRQTPVSLKTLVETGQGKFLKRGDPPGKKLLQVAQFMHRELPVRFANRVKELVSVQHVHKRADTFFDACVCNTRINYLSGLLKCLLSKSCGVGESKWTSLCIFK